MKLEPIVKSINSKILIGQSTKMSLTNNKTSALWKSFMPLRNSIENKSNTNFLSLQLYPKLYFNHFNPQIAFEKWACVEVSSINTIPEGLRTLTLEGGLYAVFDYKGSSNAPQIFEYIYGTWIPNSIYEIDHRAHFEVLGEKYKNNDPNSEEEIWIPIKNC